MSRIPLGLLVLSILLLIVGLFSIPILVQAPAINVAEKNEIARTLKNYPAAGDAYRRSAELSFDLPSKSSAVWNEAYQTAERLAPAWTTTRREFIRQAFFHWPELSDADRQRVLRETSELMRDPRTFTLLHRPLWHLTRDLNYLRRAAPRNIDSWLELMRLALDVGEFEHYRALRAEAAAIFEQSLNQKVRRRASPDEILNDLLKLERSPENRAVMRRYLDWLSENPPTGLESNPDLLTRFVDYAIRERLPHLDALVHLSSPESPLSPPVRARLAIANDSVTVADAIEREYVQRTPQWTDYLVERAFYEVNRDDIAKARQRLDHLAPADVHSAPVLAARAHLARKAGQKEEAERLSTTLEQTFSPETISAERWGLCNGAICSTEGSAITFARTPRRVSVVLAPARNQRPPAYVELLVDEHRIEEGAIETPKKFVLTIPAGLHRVRVRLLNPTALDGPRLVKLESSAAKPAAETASDSAGVSQGQQGT
jgi:hypothetical protein